MKRLIALTLGVFCAVMHAQVPDYVPTDGLVAYYPFDGNVLNMVSSDDGLSTDVSFDLDRFGQEGGALAIVSEDSEVSLPLSYLASGGEPRTISYWLRRADNTTDGEPFTGVVYNGQSCGQKSFGCGANIYTKGVSVDFSCGALTYGHATSHQECGWNHIVVVVPDIPNPVLQDIVVYENGELLEFLTGTGVTSLISTVHGAYSIGGTYGNWGDRLFDAADLTCGAPLIDDLAFYDRALSLEEVNQLFSWTPAMGCTDVEACNYDAEAVLDDDSCMDCSLFAERCGPGTAWDDETQMCIVANPADTNLDGCVQLNDLLDVLSAYGDCGAEESPWACGDPLEYQGYEYATVQIGDQCWFAENLRAENYRNGDVIPVVMDDATWNESTMGTKRAFENDLSNVSTMGYLYSWFAGNDDRELCPTGWHVPSKTELAQIEMALGMSESDALSEGWHGSEFNVSERMRSSSWGGTDELGFNAIRAPWHSGDPNATQFLTSTLWDSNNGLNSTTHCWTVVVTSYQQSNYHADSALPGIYSARCLQDPE